jgi:hypothetical protein
MALEKEDELIKVEVVVVRLEELGEVGIDNGSSSL